MLPLLISFFALWLSASAGQMYLEFVDVATGRVVYRLRVYPGFRFAINYHHSVDHQPIYEFFRVDEDGNIVLEWTKFKSFGAGMGYWKSRGKLEDCGGWLCIKDMNYRVGSFVMVVGARGVDHTLLVHGKRILNFSKGYAHRKLLVRVRYE